MAQDLDRDRRGGGAVRSVSWCVVWLAFCLDQSDGVSILSVGCIPNELVNKRKEKKRKGKEVVVKTSAPPTAATRWTDAAAATPQLKKRPSLPFRVLRSANKSPGSDATASPSLSSPSTSSLHSSSFGSSPWGASTPSLASSPLSDRFAHGADGIERLDDGATEQVRVREPGRLRRMTSSILRRKAGGEDKENIASNNDTGASQVAGITVKC